MKPMLACDWDPAKQRFPVLVQPKIDGVRALNMHGGLTGRSLKLFKNKYTTSVFSRDFFKGFDGELVYGTVTNPDLCRVTTSAVGTITGEPLLTWWLFDYLTPLTAHLTYRERLTKLDAVVRAMQNEEGIATWTHRLRVVPTFWVENMEQLEAIEAKYLAEGYEGIILRDPNGLHKQGRATVREGTLLRVKRFVESEAIVREIVEGDSNQNEAQVNELGLQFRSSHQANMIPNGLVGSLTCEALETCKDGNRVVIEKGQIITVSPGNMDHTARRHYFMHQADLVGQTIKFKFFPKGVKDKPRFPTFVTIRDKADM